MREPIKSFLLLAVLISLISCASKPKEMNKRALIHYNAGTQSLLNQDYTDALTNLLQANSIEPDNAEILNNLGMAYYFKGDNNLALKYLNQTIKMDPKNSDAKNNIASIYMEENRLQEAEALYLQVKADLTYEKQARTHYNLGILELEKRNNPVAAEKYFLSSLKEAQDYCPSHYKLGTIHFSRREFNKAYKSFREATMGTCLNFAPAHYNQALSLIELRKFNDARMKLDEVINKFNKSPIAVKARQKMLELNEIEKSNSSLEAQSLRKVINSPEF